MMPIYDKKTKLSNIAGGVVIHKITRKIVIVEQLYDTWSLPKGHIEKNETPLKAAKREIYEETGIRQLLKIQEEPPYQRYKIGLDKQDDHSELKTIHMFVFETEQKELDPKDENNPQAKWIFAQEGVSLLTNKKDQEFLQQFIIRNQKLWNIEN